MDAPETTSRGDESDPLAARRAMGRSFRSLTREHGFEPLRIEGTLPPELRGTLYRNGPALFEAQGTPYRHWLDGDGAISAARFDGRGGATGAVRVTVTRELAEEREAGRMLYGSGFTKGPIWRKRLFGGGKNGTNVHVLAWQERVFAMPENGLPIEIDPDTLATKGPWNLDGALSQLVNAHARIHPSTGATYVFGPTMGIRNTLDLYELPREGEPRRLVSIPMKRPVMVVHDLAMSEGHVVFVQHPVRVSVLPMMLGIGTALDSISYHPDDGSEFIVVSLAPPHEVVRIRVPAFFHFHYVNAFDDGDALVVDFTRYPSFDLGEAFMLDALRSGEGWTRAPIGKLTRARIDRRLSTVTFDTLWEENCDFGVTAPAMQGKAARFVWGLVAKDHVDRIEKLDTTTGEVRKSSFSLMECPGEPNFVPRPGATGEDDGFILTMVYDAASDKSFVAVLDAKDPATCLAKVWFDQAIPFPIHGMFTPSTP